MVCFQPKLTCGTLAIIVADILWLPVHAERNSEQEGQRLVTITSHTMMMPLNPGNNSVFPTSDIQKHHITRNPGLLSPSFASSSIPALKFIELGAVPNTRNDLETSGFVQMFTSGTIKLAAGSIAKVFRKEQNRTSQHSMEGPIENLNEDVLETHIALMYGVATCVFWIVVSLIVAYFYEGNLNMPSTKLDPAEEFDSWAVDPFGCLEDMETCSCATCCLTVRWSLTVSLLPNSLSFWTAFSCVTLLILPSYAIKISELFIFLHQVRQRGFNNMQDLDVDTTEEFGGLLELVSIFAATVLTTTYRQKIRTQYKMKNGFVFLLADFFLYLCFPWCAAAQEATHVEKALLASYEGDLAGQPVAVVADATLDPAINEPSEVVAVTTPDPSMNEPHDNT